MAKDLVRRLKQKETILTAEGERIDVSFAENGNERFSPTLQHVLTTYSVSTHRLIRLVPHVCGEACLAGPKTRFLVLDHRDWMAIRRILEEET